MSASVSLQKMCSNDTKYEEESEEELLSNFDKHKRILGKVSKDDINLLENEIIDIKKIEHIKQALNIAEDSPKNDECQDFFVKNFKKADFKKAIKALESGDRVRIFWENIISCDELLNIFDEFGADKTDLKDIFKNRGRVAKMILDNHVAQLKQDPNNSNKYLYHCKFIDPLINNENYNPKIYTKLDLDFEENVTNDPHFKKKISNELSAVFNCKPENILIEHLEPGSVTMIVGIAVGGGVILLFAIGTFVYKSIQKKNHLPYQKYYKKGKLVQFTKKKNQTYKGKVINVEDKTVTVDFFMKRRPYWVKKKVTFYKTDKRLTSQEPTPQNIKAQVIQETKYGCAQFKLGKETEPKMS